MSVRKLVLVSTVLAAIASASLLASPQAQAQNYSHTPKIDIDAESESSSEFWEAVVSGNDEGLQELIRHARTLWDSGGKQERERALQKLESAIQSQPASVDAQFLLGQFHFEARNWKGCAQAFSRTYELAPAYKLTIDRERSDLQANLASCLLYAGQYESAIDHLRRMLAQDRGSSNITDINLHLGQALMAIGRLQEAIDALRIAQERSVRSAATIAYAVALDRAELLTESRRVLHREVLRRPDLAALRAAETLYAPPEDEHYYLGLAYAEQKKPARALYHFRRYLALAKDSAWATRARAHVADLGAPELANTIETTGSAEWNAGDLRTAIRKHGSALQGCMQGQDFVLATLSLTGVVGEGGTAVEVQARIDDQIDTEQSRLDAIVECLEASGRKIRVPKLSGPRGSHASARFSILSAP